MARRRKFSEEPFGPTIERLMGETGVTYRGLADKTKLSAGYLNHLVHGNRPGAIEQGGRPARQGARRRAGALPRVPPARDHAAARGDARPDRPALQAARGASPTPVHPRVLGPARGVSTGLWITEKLCGSGKFECYPPLYTQPKWVSWNQWTTRRNG